MKSLQRPDAQLGHLLKHRVSIVKIDNAKFSPHPPSPNAAQ
jgi:hypothetical protein